MRDDEVIAAAERARHRDGLHRRAPLPPLKGWSPTLPAVAAPEGAAAPLGRPGGHRAAPHEAPRSRRAGAGVHRPPRHRRAGPLARLDAEGRAADLLRQSPEPLRLGADLGRAAARPARDDAADRGARLLDRDPVEALDHARDLQRRLRQPPAPKDGTARRRRPARAADGRAPPRRLAGHLSRRERAATPPTRPRSSRACSRSRRHSPTSS